MLGHGLFTNLLRSERYAAHGTVRKKSEWMNHLPPDAVSSRVHEGADANAFDSIVRVFEKVRPDIVVNCVGVVKQRADSSDPLVSIPLNSLLPHRLAGLCDLSGARLIHISTDCVFSGEKGRYVEDDFGDARDMYGQSKYLGEVRLSSALTIRTSYIGHELASYHGLIDWFLSQTGQVKGFTRALYSGLPVVELCHVMEEYIFPNDKLTGLLQVSSDPISKFDLLTLVARSYGKKIEIQPTDAVSIDRTLDSTRFREQSGYKPPNWESLVEAMHRSFISSKFYADKKIVFGM